MDKVKKQKTKKSFKDKVIKAVKETPNDSQLGKKIRAYINDKFIF